MSARLFDVLIVGAGPSGSECARTLGKSGARVLLLDKKRAGWHKPCGGGISELALRRYGVPLSLAYPTAGVRIFDGEGSASIAPLPFYDVRRNHFDEFLSGDAAAAGVEVHLGSLIQKLVRTDDGFEVETPEGSCHARYLVGADGFSSTVRERLFPEKLDATTAAIALEYWFEWDHGIRHLDFYVEPELLPLGYAYAFPKDDRTITIGIAGLEIADPRALLDELLELPRYRAMRGPGARTAVHGARIPYRPLSNLRAGRLLLCGDAAGLNTPIAFAGLPIALKSGRAAGTAIAAALRTGSDDPLADYTSAKLAEESWSFRACHVYWRHLCQTGTLMDWPAFFLAASNNPAEELVMRVTWGMLKTLSERLDLPRLRKYEERGSIDLSTAAAT